MPRPIPPPIAPVSPDGERPFWSVMIPTYNADDLLETTIRSVLDQHPGPNLMEVVVVDDRSPNGHAEAVVRRLGSDRVRFHPGESNVGLARNWNRCIAVSRGRWVHILHQDDLVLPGFYDRLALADADPRQPGMAFCGHAVIDAAGETISGSLCFAVEPGLLPDLIKPLASTNHLQCPAIVVRRAVYERLGGFLPELTFVLDWEMWVRIVAEYPVWYEPARLAFWRNHPSNESARLRRESAIGPDVKKGIAVIKRYKLPLRSRLLAGRQMLFMVRREQIEAAREALAGGNYRAGLAAVKLACASDKSYWFKGESWKLIRQGLKLWLQDRSGQTRTPSSKK